MIITIDTINYSIQAIVLLFESNKMTVQYNEVAEEGIETETKVIEISNTLQYLTQGELTTLITNKITEENANNI